MATSKGSNKTVFRFELGWSGLFGLSVVSFCIFLWLFLLGVWAGQTILSPPEGAGSLSFAKLSGKAATPPKNRAVEPRPQPAPENVGDSAPAAAESAETSFFSLQVGAFRDADFAGRSVQEWRAKGYEAFVQPVEENSDGLARVFIGKFEKLSDANTLAAKLDSEENVQAYISLLPASKIHLP